MSASLVGTRRLDWLRSQREAAVAEVSGIAERAADEDRDLTETENASCVRRREAVEKLDAEITVEVETCERQARFEDLAGRIEPALNRTRVSSPSSDRSEPAGEVVYRSAGEYLADFIVLKRENDPVAGARMEKYRAGLLRANQVVDSNLGIVPTPVVGPVINTINARRPAISAATSRPMPSGGRSFTRPRLTQHTAVGVQATEKTALSSQAMLIDELTVTKATYGGSVNLSWQDRDWSQPAIIDLLIADLAAVYASTTDAAFCTAFAAAVTQTVDARTGSTPAGPADATSWLAGIYEAAALVFAAGNALPDTLWVAPDTWAALGSLVDGSGRPMFPAISPSNTLGSLSPGSFDGQVAGFKVVVDAHLASGTGILGDSNAVEVYEQVGGTVSAVEPTILGTAVAYYGYFASLVVRPNSFVKIRSV